MVAKKLFGGSINNEGGGGGTMSGEALSGNGDWYWKLHASGREECLRCPYPLCIYDYPEGSPGRQGPCLLRNGATLARPPRDAHREKRRKILRKIAGLIAASTPLTFAECAELTGVAVNTLRAWRRRGHLICHSEKRSRGVPRYIITGVKPERGNEAG